MPWLVLRVSRDWPFLHHLWSEKRGSQAAGHCRVPFGALSAISQDAGDKCWTKRNSLYSPAMPLPHHTTSVSLAFCICVLVGGSFSRAAPASLHRSSRPTLHLSSYSPSPFAAWYGTLHGTAGCNSTAGFLTQLQHGGKMAKAGCAHKAQNNRFGLD